ncbi:MAG: hypothetical protein QGH07_11710 [Alphaproteobacteria bacterium]|nr:hypothetical protein [Alphaproteobacteria bacterium]
MIGEKIGKPSVGIMTTKFVSAAELMARVLGADGYPFVVIDHPISSASDATIDTWARQAARESMDLLIGANR